MSEWLKRLSCGLIGLCLGAAGQLVWSRSDLRDELSQLTRSPTRELRRNTVTRPPLRPAEARRQL